MTDLTLTNEGAPTFVKPDPKAWADATPIEKNAQAIYGHLQKVGDGVAVTLHNLSQGLGISYMSVFWAARRLVLEGFALQEDVKVATPSNRNPNKTENHIAIRFIPPWQPKRKVKWNYR